LAGARGAVFCAVADGDEHPAAAPRATATTSNSVGLIMVMEACL
jgi:hypothetical protein